MAEFEPANRDRSIFIIALDLLEEHLPAFILLVMVTVFLIQIVFRYFFAALPWPEELVGFLFLWLACFGVGFAERTESLIRFEMIHNALNQRNQLRLNIFGDVLVLIALGILFWPALGYIIDINYRNSDVLKINMSIVYAPFMVLLTGLIVRSALRVRRDVIKLRTRREEPAS